jgi:hypothetical protein
MTLNQKLQLMTSWFHVFAYNKRKKKKKKKKKELFHMNSSRLLQVPPFPDA